MAVFKTDGTELTDADITTLAGAGEAGPKTYTIDEEVIVEFTFGGTKTKGKKILFHKGQKVSQKQLDDALALAKDV